MHFALSGGSKWGGIGAPVEPPTPADSCQYHLLRDQQSHPAGAVQEPMT